MTHFDLAALALLLVFGYSGYRRGLVVFVLQLAGGVLAFALAAFMAPALVPYLAQHLRVPDALLRPVAIAGLTLVLRAIFEFAVRELALALRGVLDAVPPLTLIDRTLGIVPGLALGGLVVLAITLALLSLPKENGLHGAAAESWLARNVVTRPEEAIASVRRMWAGLVLAPPRMGLLPVAAGAAALWLGALAAWRMRDKTDERLLREAPTRPMPHAYATEDTVDLFAWARATLGLAAAGAIAVLLLLLIHLRV
jgi:uncharacterized membrane protein required for colicin V production